MSNHKRSANSQQETLDERQRRSLLIVGFLQQLALPSVFNRELSEQDFETWQKLLGNYPLEAISWAFENWSRNGKMFPKPANILELIGAWAVTNKAGGDFQPCGTCNDGWIAEYNERSNRILRRCECFVEWANRKKEQAA
jgi:hypothetical protein